MVVGGSPERPVARRVRRPRRTRRTVAACAFAGLLLKIVTSSEVGDLLREAVRRAFSIAF
jgi:hypothetical protein